MRRRRLRGLPRLGLWLLYLLLAALAFRAAASLRRALPGYSLRFAAPVTAAQARALREAAAEGEFEPVFWGLGQGGAVDAGLRAGTAEELLVWGEPVEAAAPGRLTGGGWPSAKDAMGCAVSEALAWRLWGSRAARAAAAASAGPSTAAVGASPALRAKRCACSSEACSLRGSSSTAVKGVSPSSCGCWRTTRSVSSAKTPRTT